MSILLFISYFLSIIAFLIIHAFFVTSKYALVNVDPLRFDQLASQGNKRASKAQAHIQHLPMTLAGIHLGMALSSLTLGWISGIFFPELVDTVFTWIGLTHVTLFLHIVFILVSFLVLAAVLSVLGGFVPKALALQQSEEMLLHISPLLFGYILLLKPLLLALNSFGNVFIHTRVREHDGRPLEQIQAPDVSEKAEQFGAKQDILAHFILSLQHKTVSQVMQPRANIVAVPRDISLEQLQATFLQQPYTCLPVFEDNLDTIVGCAHIKDLYKWVSSQTFQPFSLFQITRPVIDVAENTPIPIVWKQMQSLPQSQQCLVIVHGENMLTTGMLTPYDLLNNMIPTSPKDLPMGIDLDRFFNEHITEH